MKIGFTIAVFTGVLFFFAMMFIVFIINYQKKTLSFRIKQEKLKYEHQEEMMKSIIKAQDDEKGRIGRELHDDINGLMMLAKLKIQQLSDKNKNEAINSISDAMGKTRELSHNLAFSVLEAYGLKHTLNQFISKLKSSVDFEIEYNCHLINDPDIEISKQYFRIAQEAITNINKYAKATKVVIILDDKDSELSLSIIDNGIGFDIEKAKNGIGLHNMKFRAKTIGVDIQVKSEPNLGTSIYLKKEL